MRQRRILLDHSTNAWKDNSANQSGDREVSVEETNERKKGKKRRRSSSSSMKKNYKHKRKHKQRKNIIHLLSSSSESLSTVSESMELTL